MPSTAESWRTFLGEHVRDDVQAFVGNYPEERSLYVDVFDIHRYDQEFLEALFADPDGVLDRGTEALRSAHDDLGRVHLRLENVPSQLSVGAVGTRHVSKLVAVEGSAGVVGGVEAKATGAAYVCESCGASWRERPRGIDLSTPSRCPECDAAGTPRFDRDRSTFVDVQRVDLVEGDDGPTIPVYLDDDIVGTFEEEDTLRVTGILRLAPSAGENRFSFYLDGLTVEERTPGQVLEERDVDEQLKESIRSRWEVVVGE